LFLYILFLEASFRWRDSFFDLSDNAACHEASN
jgi:hypothetical protein